MHAAGQDDMILGIGSDITDARRIAKVINRHGDRFLDRVFTPTERAKADRRRNRVETYAKRFAAKEACAKALGTGLRAGVWWRDMGVVNLPGARPPDTRCASMSPSPTKGRWRMPWSSFRRFRPPPRDRAIVAAIAR
jgi:holo-[acyl-carrier-protein] synthase